MVSCACATHKNHTKSRLQYLVCWDTQGVHICAKAAVVKPCSQSKCTNRWKEIFACPCHPCTSLFAHTAWPNTLHLSGLQRSSSILLKWMYVTSWINMGVVAFVSKHSKTAGMCSAGRYDSAMNCLHNLQLGEANVLYLPPYTLEPVERTSANYNFRKHTLDGCPQCIDCS